MNTSTPGYGSVERYVYVLLGSVILLVVLLGSLWYALYSRTVRNQILARDYHLESIRDCDGIIEGLLEIQVEEAGKGAQIDRVPGDTGSAATSSRGDSSIESFALYQISQSLQDLIARQQQYRGPEFESLVQRASMYGGIIDESLEKGRERAAGLSDASQLLLIVIEQIETLHHNTLADLDTVGREQSVQNARILVFAVLLFSVVGFITSRGIIVAIRRSLSDLLVAEEGTRRAESRMATVLESASDAILSIDERGIILSANAATKRIFGYEIEALIGKNVSILMSPPHREKHDGYLERYLSTGEKKIIGIGREVVGRRKDLREFPLDLSVGESRFGGKSIFTGVIRDITERKKAEAELALHREHLEDLVAERTQELESAQEELLRQERLATLGRLITTVGHELRNPLGTVRNSVYLVRQKTDVEEAGLGPILDRADRNIQRCDLIIEELLDYAREMELRPEATEIDPWLRQFFEEQLLPSGINLRLELDASAEVEIDRERMRRCLVNVLSNAIQELSGEIPDRGEGEIVVASRNREGRLEMSISDTGRGISEKNLARIFEPLFSTKSFGVGLGLSIVKRIMEFHGGGIEIESEIGQGTTVTLWLPLIQERES